MPIRTSTKKQYYTNHKNNYVYNTQNIMICYLQTKMIKYSKKKTLHDFKLHERLVNNSTRKLFLQKKKNNMQ